MNTRESLDRIKPIESEVAPTEALSEGAVARVVFILQLELGRFTASIVHVVRSIGCRTDLKARWRVLVALTVLYVELGLFQVFFVLGVRVYALALEVLLD